MRAAICRAACAITLLWSSGAGAEEYIPLTIINNSDKTIVGIHFSELGYDDWASNRLEGAGIAPGESRSIVLDALDGCDWKVRATYQDGATSILTDIRPCDQPVIAVD